MFRKLTAYRLKKAGRPDLIPVLTPSYPPGCKRIAKSGNYLEALAMPNVTVVPRAVKETNGNIIIDTEGNKEHVDVLVLATGFDVEGFLGNLDSKYIL
jgi:cation diffusion facilitator CzcD-associated flavoprotein CzcO